MTRSNVPLYSTIVVFQLLWLVFIMIFFIRSTFGDDDNRKLSKQQQQQRHLRGTRMLHEQRAIFNVQLFLDLQFVDESLALDFETLDVTNPNIVHFCQAIQTQIFGTIVTAAASAYNATFVSEEPTENGPWNGCAIVATSRVYDPEAEDVFGTGYFSLQVHVSQRVIVESSNQTLYLEVVQAVIETGFDVVGGGQREFRNTLYQNSVFRSVISVSLRRGLTAPALPPSPKPTVLPSTMAPSKRPSRAPTQAPTRSPTKHPTAVPTLDPSAAPTRQPSVSPTVRPSAIPSVAPSGLPSEAPSGYPSGHPSATPSTSPSSIPSAVPTPNPSTSPSWSPSGNPTARSDVLVVGKDESSVEQSETIFNNPVVVASILGASIVLALMSCLVCYLCYRYQTKTRRYTIGRSPIPLSQKHSNNIPGVVELGEEQQSLADTSLGEHTVGGALRKQGRKPPIHKSLGSFDENSLYTTPFPIDEELANTTPGEHTLGWATTRGQKPPIRKGLGSFDERSLYTTPFPIDEEPRAKAMLPLQLQSVQSSLSSRLMIPLEYEERVVFPSSESVSEESSDGVELPLALSKLSKAHKESPVGTASTTTNSILHDLDFNEPYYNDVDITKITKIEPIDSHPAVAEANDDFSRIPSELDVWSCDFDDFDRESDFYKGEEQSKSPSFSSTASTHRIKNDLPTYSLLSKRDVDSTNTVAEIPKPTHNVGGNRKKTTLPAAVPSKENSETTTRKHIDVSSIALRVRNENTKPVNTIPKRSSDDKKTPTSPEDGSQSSKKTSMSELSTDTKTGAPAIDCLSGDIASTLKDGVNTIDSLSNGIVTSLKGGAPHIESIGNGLVSSLTDIFDRMAIPKITPEGNESLYSEQTSESKKGSLSGEPSPKPAPDDVAKSVSDDESGMSASPWLMEKIEDTLGPKSTSADLASMSSKSLKSRHSHSQLPKRQSSSVRRNDNQSKVGHRIGNTRRTNIGSEVSYGSRRHRKAESDVSNVTRSTYSRFSGPDFASIMSKASKAMSADILAQQTPDEISFVRSSRSTLEDGIKRLEKQLEALDQKDKDDAASSVTMSSVTWGSYSTISTRSKTYRNRRKVLVIVPPGKLGVILADLHDGKGTIIQTIRSDSPVTGILKPGDKLIAVDEIAVVEMSCSQITSLIASRADQERRFTVMTTVFKTNDAGAKDI